jgi:hypothetical protein
MRIVSMLCSCQACFNFVMGFVVHHDCIVFGLPVNSFAFSFIAIVDQLRTDESRLMCEPRTDEGWLMYQLWIDERRLLALHLMPCHPEVRTSGWRIWAPPLYH